MVLRGHSSIFDGRTFMPKDTGVKDCRDTFVVSCVLVRLSVMRVIWEISLF